MPDIEIGKIYLLYTENHKHILTVMFGCTDAHFPSLNFMRALISSGYPMDFSKSILSMVICLLQ